MCEVNTAEDGGGVSNFLGRGCLSYFLGKIIQGFGTAYGAREEILTFAYCEDVVCTSLHVPFWMVMQIGTPSGFH